MSELRSERRFHRLKNEGDESLEMAFLDSARPPFGKAGTDRSTPTLLLLHGLFSNSDTWQYLWPLVAPRFRLIAPDLVGFGHSSRPRLGNLPKSERYSAHMFCRQLKQFLNDLDLRNVVLCGHSLGGGLCLYLLIHFPDLASRIQGLVLINAAGHPQKLPGYIEELGGWPGTLADTGPCRWLLQRTGVLKRIVNASIKRTVLHRPDIAGCPHPVNG
jgi:pimeloyl-ACP methyl ester carboxylesterase